MKAETRVILSLYMLCLLNSILLKVSPACRGQCVLLLLSNFSEESR
jgi:hypothetical protein